MTDPQTHRTRSGRILTDEDVDALATQVEETNYDVEGLETLRRDRHLRAADRVLRGDAGPCGRGAR
ncbi:hypothetical protein BMS3Abin02_00441 [bacterium BMS3Abin02]|nr:hypothetical protein BMS3Abin02_00441 [bacterium BMS3Abin02]GBE20861.1 hypothetical protein BMS3Bbin01_00202 [bacterium BMS3Bbin01]